MSNFRTQTLEVAGVATQVVRGGQGPRAIVLLHGGAPGVTPYAGGSYLWGRMLEDLAADAEVIAIDMLGSGGTGYPFDRALTLEDMNQHVAATLQALDLRSYHVIGHDIGGLVALWLGMQEGTRASSLTIAASSFSTAIGEEWEDLTLASPPQPLLGRDSHRWVFDRLSADVAHIDAPLLDAAAKTGQASGVTRAAAAMASPQARAGFLASHGLVRAKMWARSREAGYPIPVQIIWGAQDPLTTVAQGQILFKALGSKQPVVQFHVLNEAGSFVFREQPARFKRIVKAFLDALEVSQSAGERG